MCVFAFPFKCEGERARERERWDVCVYICVFEQLGTANVCMYICMYLIKKKENMGKMQKTTGVHVYTDLS